MMKIIYSLDINPAVEYENEIIRKLQSHGYEFTVIDWVSELDLGYQHRRYPSAQEIRRMYEAKDPLLMKLYDKVRRLAKTHDVLLVAQSHVYLPEFIESLEDVYTVFYSADDPDSSDVCSRPYVKSYDHIFVAGVNFDETTRISEKLGEWGARKVDWWPLGFRGDTYNPELTVEDILNKNREIDLVFVGALLNRKRLDYLVKLKKAFPGMKIFSRNFRDPKFGTLLNIYFTLKTRRPSRGSHLAHNRLSPAYQNTKIGINMHLTYGPSNIRTYQLPANGVMQLCDCAEGLSQVYEVGKEVILYESIDEAIELTGYYLENEEERNKIAIAGFKRALKDYNREHTFLEALKKIERGITKEG